ncbi:hypothetical protein SS50377_23145 [Spironucleus salmonicida]|uniref:Transmembrane protein n=1 Tax=Spironucleus salmonicida TaxID=348837 RepID=V6LB72_9EUKA|nr:hypothetical protein SS50377_23145 [Spironucleus salmonicida]|eukprot:EST41680.1 Hypothetical protein SS50377_18767 [Spironucleus salmonicida]
MLALVISVAATAIIDQSQGPSPIVSFTFADPKIKCTDFQLVDNCEIINTTLRYYPKGKNGLMISNIPINYKEFFTVMSGFTADVLPQQLLETAIPFVTSRIQNIPQNYVCNQVLQNIEFMLFGIPFVNQMIQGQPNYNQALLTSGNDILGTNYANQIINFTIGDIIYSSDILLSCTDCVNTIKLSGTRVIFDGLQSANIELQSLQLGQTSFTTIGQAIPSSMHTGGQFAFFNVSIPVLPANSFLRLKVVYNDVCFNQGVNNIFFQNLAFSIAVQLPITFDQANNRHIAQVNDLELQNCLTTAGNILDLVVPEVGFSIDGYIFAANILTFNNKPGGFYKIKVQNYTLTDFTYQCTNLQKLIVFIDKTNSIFQLQPGIVITCGITVDSFPFQFVNVPQICQSLIGPTIEGEKINLTWDSCLNYQQSIETQFSPHTLSFTAIPAISAAGIPLPTTQIINLLFTYTNIQIQTVQLINAVHGKLLCQIVGSASPTFAQYTCDLQNGKVGIYDISVSYQTVCTTVITQILSQISFTLNIILDIILTTWVSTDRLNNQVPSGLNINYNIIPSGALLQASVDNCYEFTSTTIKFTNINMGPNPDPSQCLINIFYLGSQDQYRVMVLPIKNLFIAASCNFANSEYDIHNLVQLIAQSTYSIQCLDVNNVQIPANLISVNSQPAYAFQPILNSPVMITYCLISGECDTKTSAINIVELVLPTTQTQFLALPSQQKRIVIQKLSRQAFIQGNQPIVNLIFNTFINCTVRCYSNYLDIPITNVSSQLAITYRINTSIDNLKKELNNNIIESWMQFYRIIPQILTQAIFAHKNNAQSFSDTEIQAIYNAIPINQNGFNFQNSFISPNQSIQISNFFFTNVQLSYSFGTVSVTIFSSSRSTASQKFPISVDGQSLKFLISSQNYVFVQAVSTTEVIFQQTTGSCGAVNSQNSFSFTLLGQVPAANSCTQKNLPTQIVCTCQTQLQGTLITLHQPAESQFTPAEIFGISLGSVLLITIVVATAVMLALKFTGRL